jgi:glutathione synthase
MVHVDPLSSQVNLGLKQVEFNTIASSFGGLSARVSSLHRYLLSVEAYPPNTSSIIKNVTLPESKSIPGLASGIAIAHKSYGQSANERPLCVLFIVQEPERNVFDQRLLEYELISKYSVHVFRLPFARVLHHTKVDSSRNLTYVSPHLPSKEWEVTTIYYRAGYSPDDYPNETAWQARTHLERSRAIKCPSILTHLAGCKKVQQVLATPDSPHLSRFIADESTVSRLRNTFAPMYPLDTSEAGLEGRRLAIDPETARHYVLKPQREGGGNNIYRNAIPEFLKQTSESHWPAYILMEIIEPPALNNVIIRNGEVQKGGVIGELGVYGVCLWKHPQEGLTGDHVIENYEAGYLLRTKGNQSEEGGVAAGFGAVDSCCLIDV